MTDKNAKHIFEDVSSYQHLIEKWFFWPYQIPKMGPTQEFSSHEVDYLPPWYHFDNDELTILSIQISQIFFTNTCM